METGRQETDQILCQILSRVLRKWYWNDTYEQNSIQPVMDVIEYVREAKKAGLNKQSEISYCGTIFLHSVLYQTGRDFTSDVEEANELYDAGRILASRVWDRMDEKRSMTEYAVSLLSLRKETRTKLRIYD